MYLTANNQTFAVKVLYDKIGKTDITSVHIFNMPEKKEEWRLRYSLEPLAVGCVSRYKKDKPDKVYARTMAFKDALLEKDNYGERIIPHWLAKELFEEFQRECRVKHEQ